MRIGLYGMPTAGKSYILERIDFMEVVLGSKLLRQQNPDFDLLDEEGRKKARERFAAYIAGKQDFIMDGHYAFGDEVAFTEADGNMYDAFVYLYIDPEILSRRMKESDRNRKYLVYDIRSWQNLEINCLREYCHDHDKDFYVIDNPPENAYIDTDSALAFIKIIHEGYSCLGYAKQCAEAIYASINDGIVTLLDGDKTITVKDTSNAVFGYTTHLYDGNFYTGYQAWKQSLEFRDYSIPEIQDIPVPLNNKVLSKICGDSVVLTSGHEKIWGAIASKLGFGCFCGNRMSADTKFFVTKLLQEKGMRVIAFGDGMNDYYMLKKADEGYLVTKADGSLSRSLRGKDMEGLIYV